MARPRPSTWFGGTPPKSAGRFRPRDYYYLGELPAVASGKPDITALYTARFGAPAAGQKVFVCSKQVLDGYDDLPHQWSGIVPAASRGGTGGAKGR